MNILILPIKGEFFDMIEAGIKPEEYRDIKAHYVSRLIEIDYPKNKNRREVVENILYDIICGHNWERFSSFKKFDAIEFRKGYGKKVPRLVVEHLGTEIGEVRPEWAGGWTGSAFVLKLGKILSRTN